MGQINSSMFGKIGWCEPESYMFSKGCLGTNFFKLQISKKNKKNWNKVYNLFYCPHLHLKSQDRDRAEALEGGNTKITNLNEFIGHIRDLMLTES